MAGDVFQGVSGSYSNESKGQIRATLGSETSTRTGKILVIACLRLVLVFINDDLTNVTVFDDGTPYSFTIPSRDSFWEDVAGSPKGSEARSPMPGKIVKVRVKAGDKVTMG